ncbi:hypothetical protein ACX801_13270 [Arthrobacter bambusae]
MPEKMIALIGIPRQRAMSAGTPRHTIRVSDELRNEAHRKAVREGTSVSELIRTRLRDYVSAPAEHRHTIADSLVYLVPNHFNDLHGPATGTMELPLHLADGFLLAGGQALMR